VLRGKEAQKVYSLLISPDLQGALNLLQRMQKEAFKKRKRRLSQRRG
jgi:hypothetical protein